MCVMGEAAKAALGINDLAGDGGGFGGEQERDDVGGLVRGVPAAARHVSGDEGLLVRGGPAGVSAVPGLTQLTVMARSASASASVRAICCNAPFVAA